MALKFFGHLGYGDMETPFSSPIVQAEFLEETVSLVQRYRDETDAIFNLFVERDTEEPQLRYGLDEHGGYMQRLGGHDQPKSLKGAADITVGFPLELFGESIVMNRRGVAKLTVDRYDRLVDGLFRRHSATIRHEMFRRLFKKTSDTYKDQEFGSVTVQPLANGDSQTYPLGTSGALAAANHYIGANFTTISDANNPYALIYAKWIQVFPNEVAGTNAITFIHSDQEATTTALAAFTELPDPNVIPSPNDARLTNIPRVPGTARLIGRVSGQWVAVWDAAVDTGYMISFHPNVAPPLIRRVDRAQWGLPRGLNMVAETGYDVMWPWNQQIYEDSVGFGVGNRLGAVCLQLVASTTFTTPTRYNF